MEEKQHRLAHLVIRFFFLVSIYLPSICIAQHNHSIPPEFIYISYTKWDKKYGIRYYLPDRPAIALDSICNAYSQLHGKVEYFIEFVTNEDTTDIYGYRVLGRLKKLKKNDQIARLLKSTHRYILINKKRVPLYFPTDIKFGFPDFAFTGYDFHIRFTGNKLSSGKILTDPD